MYPDGGGGVVQQKQPDRKGLLTGQLELSVAENIWTPSVLSATREFEASLGYIVRSCIRKQGWGGDPRACCPS